MTNSAAEEILSTDEPRATRGRALVIAAVVGLLCVAILAAVLVGAGSGDVEPEPLGPPTPSPSPESNVRGWPTTGRNAPGVYSMDGFRSCGRGGSWCNQGWMHNGYGSNDVEIWILGVDPLQTHTSKWPNPETGAGRTIREDATPVVVAGYDGFYRRVDDRRERWMVDIDGTPVGIQLTSKPGTSQADLAEAHAIIDSMRTEPTDHLYVSFRLVFTITSNDWDSG